MTIADLPVLVDALLPTVIGTAIALLIVVVTAWVLIVSSRSGR